MKRNILLLSIASLLAGQSGAHSQDIFTPGSLLISTSTYEGTAGMITPGVTVLPVPGGTTKATADGAFPEVFNNDIPDANFGVTSPIFINQITTTGTPVNINNPNSLSYVSGNTLAVPTSLVTTSFSSKSELALNLSTDGTAITFMGYDAPINTLDTSNTNTPADPGAPAVTTPATYREVVQLNLDGSLEATTTNAYSTNNGRAAILANGLYYTAGNGGSLTFTGAETVVPGSVATPSTPGTNVLGEYVFSGDNDKNGKDNNFRGIAIYNNLLYVSKGSGSKGVDSVYQVGAGSPTATNNVLATGTGNPITILPGLPGSTQGASLTGTFTPFGIWFANKTTMYVADEGLAAPNPGTSVTTGSPTILQQAAADQNAGLEKWTFDGTKWNLDYTLQLGLNLGQQYSVAGLASNLDPAAVGLRALTGQVNGDGTVTLFATTSTLSNLGDVGADSNQLVSITDTLADSTLSQASSESFSTLETAAEGQVIRGVSFAPTPEPGSAVLLLFGGVCAGSFRRRRAAC